MSCGESILISGVWLVLVPRHEVRCEGFVVACEDRRSRIGNEALIEAHVVDRAEHGGEHFVRCKKVMDVRAGESARAGVAIARRIDRERVAPELSVCEADAAAGGEYGGRARITRGNHAVEHVDAEADTRDQVFGQAIMQAIMLAQDFNHRGLFKPSN